MILIGLKFNKEFIYVCYVYVFDYIVRVWWMLKGIDLFFVLSGSLDYPFLTFGENNIKNE